MHTILTSGIALAALATGASVVAQGSPGAPDAKRVAAGSYNVDTNHTQVFWTVNHMGLTPLSGAFSASGGRLDIDPAKPSAAKVTVTFNVAGMSTTAPAFTKHLMSGEFFEADKFPTANFTSNAVQISGSRARISGNLTMHGVTKPVTLDAQLFGAGTNPMSKKLDLGFTATAVINRSDFGLGYALPVVADRIDLKITAAFERAN